jgi:hypothetical protein
MLRTHCPRSRSKPLHARAWLVLVALALALASSPGFLHAARAQERRDCRVDYAIEARLDESAMRVDGRERIRFENRSRDRIEELWFHLYLNAFANDESTHLTESRGKLRGLAIDSGWGWSRVVSARSGEADLMPSFRWRTSPQGSAQDRTVFSLALPRALDPGETLELELEWESQLPRVRRRTGFKDDFVLAAHWFPKLGVYEDGRGWNCHPFHANTEFFSDYGTYEVKLDLPERYAGRVGGSGVQVQSLARPGGRIEVAYVAPSPEDQQRSERGGKRPLVHDFAWTADADYRPFTGRFHYRDWADRYRSEVESAQRAFGPDQKLELRDVDVTVLMQPEHRDQSERHFQATCAALFFYGLWFGEYPFEHVTVVDPAWGASAAGGMEYPTLFTCGTRLHAQPWMHSPEGVTVHECGHQFFHTLVGNNEFESAWLDEGLNSYADSEVMARVWGPQRASSVYAGYAFDGVRLAPEPGGSRLANALAARRLDLPLLPTLEFLPSSGWLDAWRQQPWFCLAPQTSDARWQDRVGYLGDPDRDPIDTPGWEYVDRQSYSTNSYRRPAAVLRTLEGLVGRDAFLRGMREYARVWRYAHPRPDDFFRDFQAGTGLSEDLSWYFAELFRGTGTVDWSVWVESYAAPRGRGLYPDESGRFAQRESPASPTVPHETAPADSALADAQAASRAPQGEAVDAEPDEPPVGAAAERADPVDVAESAAREPKAEPDERAAPAAPAATGRPRQRTEILLVRRGELSLPIDLRITYADGRSEQRVWSREEQQAQRWLRITLEDPQSKVVSVELDPRGRYFIDADRSNDAWHAERERVAPWRWAERVYAQGAQELFWQMGLGG